MSINKRIKLVRKAFCNDSNIEFAEILGASPQYASNITSEGKSVGKTVLDKLSLAFPELNLSWLLTGEGSMLKDDSNTPQISYTKGVPYYEVDFIGGFDLVLDDQSINPAYYIDFMKYNNADCWCNVTGRSMEPEISHGDIIAIKEIQDWQSFLPFGEIYAIVTTEHRTIKKVTGCLKEDYLLLIPSNQEIEFQPQEVPKSIIRKVYKVLGCMKRL